MEYIKLCFKENKPFQIVDYFKSCKIENKILAEKEFKRDVVKISTWDLNDKSKKVISFCLNTIKNNYDVCSA